MDTSKMCDISRGQFEQRYPLPQGVAWNPNAGRYVLIQLKRCSVSQYEQHVERWVCWQASREDQVVAIKEVSHG